MKALIFMVKLLIAVNFIIAVFFAFLRLWSPVFFHIGMALLMTANLLILGWEVEADDEDEEKDG